MEVVGFEPAADGKESAVDGAEAKLVADFELSAFDTVGLVGVYVADATFEPVAPWGVELVLITSDVVLKLVLEFVLEVVLEVVSPRELIPELIFEADSFFCGGIEGVAV